ncbi:histidine kinase [Faecalispora anaeroviscerum]|uniref:histidine kinase n=1 Tax=Faecalispora anaeroviscerum TaxID=2991836 RepID=UPI0024BA0B6D|nr:histidine kinase [Faecalispora anaeroviscerum]
MSNRDYAVVLVLAAVMFLVGYNVLGTLIKEPSSTSTYGTMMVVVFALYVMYLGKKKKRPKR